MENYLGSPTLTNCSFTGNSARGYGGAIYLTGSSSTNATLTNCTFIDNSASDGGGGMCLFGGDELTLTNCTFSGNSAGTDGGGIFTMVFVFDITKFINCTFSGNSATSDGGGYYASHDYATFSNCTFSENKAGGDGGGFCIFLNGGTADFNDCILWGNRANNEGPQIAIKTASANVGVNYCDVQGDWFDVYEQYPDTLNWGSGNIDSDPCFVDADGADNTVGTEDDDLHLLADSNCIDAGDNTAVPADTADLDGDGDVVERTPLGLDYGQRFADDPCTPDSGVADPPDYVEVVDMGAYEYRYYSNTCWDAAECAGHASGDATCDGSVNLADLFKLKEHFGKSSPWLAPECCADFTHDGSINLADLFALKAGFGSSAYSPSSGNQDCPP
jgi:parallel beta-helix repeat protein/predicted outer membrane repeat protein